MIVLRVYSGYYIITFNVLKLLQNKKDNTP